MWEVCGKYVGDEVEMGGREGRGVCGNVLLLLCLCVLFAGAFGALVDRDLQLLW